MAETSSELEGPDFEKGCKIDELADGEMRSKQFWRPERDRRFLRLVQLARITAARWRRD